MASSRPVQHPQRSARSVDGGRHHRFRACRRGASASAGSPDLALAAREAVVGFLHDSSMGGPAAEATQSAGGIATATRAGIPASTAPLAARDDAESVALRAAAMGVATLDRIEAAAAKVEADIRAALQAQAELQAGAGAAAEAAVRAAEQSWIAAHKSEAAEGRARVILGLMTRYLAVTIALVVITIIFLIITASTAH